MRAAIRSGSCRFPRTFGYLGVAGGKLYVKDKTELMCFDLATSSPRRSSLESMASSSRDLRLSDKARGELAYWKGRHLAEGTLRNDHYERFYTAHFGLDRQYYRGKAILDIGCGPRGSLEWASGAGLRVGLDPLAAAYMTLGASSHAMQYVAARAEAIPFTDGSFDVVTSLNSLDHVDDLDRVAAEIERVVRPGGLVLLLTDTHSLPTVLEPIAFSWDVVERLTQRLALVEEKHYEYSATSAAGYGDMYGSLLNGVPFDHSDPTDRYGILSARFLRTR